MALAEYLNERIIEFLESDTSEVSFAVFSPPFEMNQIIIFDDDLRLILFSLFKNLVNCLLSTDRASRIETVSQQIP